MPAIWAAPAGGDADHRRQRARSSRIRSLEDPRVTLRNEHVADEELPRLFGGTTCCVLPYRQASQSGVGAHAKAYGRAISPPTSAACPSS